MFNFINVDNKKETIFDSLSTHAALDTEATPQKEIL